jgi:endo-1,4-beta-xylanase
VDPNSRPKFVEHAFRIAAEELPTKVDLLYNDYSMTAPKKRKAVADMIRALKSKGVRIDAVGMQAHWTIDHPSIEQIEKSILAYAEAGVDVHITELDIDVLPRRPEMFGAEISTKISQDPAMDPYKEGLPDEVANKLATRYADIFQLFLKHQDKIKRVTFWGVTDRNSSGPSRVERAPPCYSTEKAAQKRHSTL